MPASALPGARGHDLVRVRLDVREQFLDGLEGRVRLHMDRGEILVDERERRVLLPREIGETDPVHLVDFERDETERVAIGRGGRDRQVSDHARAAGAVHDVHRLLEIALQHHGDLARDRIGAAAGRPRHDQRDRPFRKRRLRGRAGEARHRDHRGAQISDMAKHSLPSPVFVRGPAATLCAFALCCIRARAPLSCQARALTPSTTPIGKLNT